MKKLRLVFSLWVVLLTPMVYATPSEKEIDAQAHDILSHMSIEEKIGQRLMLDFRYWCEVGVAPCTKDLTVINPEIQKILSTNFIGGVILFANNLKDIKQITTLTAGLQQGMINAHGLPLLIGTDQEGGIVVRLPRDVSPTFSGNMAIAAAFLGDNEKTYTLEIAKYLAGDIKAVGINTDFAPDVDVNVNPLNPVIHVRSFSDDPELVAKLGLELSQGIQQQGVASTIKHFPGHGDTDTDSHSGLPIVKHTSDEAQEIDLYPFKRIIEKNPPDLIMTAHIQYPALDDSKICAAKRTETPTEEDKKICGEDHAGIAIISPATLSRKIQSDLLRGQLGYKGIVITDALNMGAISQNFDALDATVKAFQAGVDIALMPIAITNYKDGDNLSMLITKLKTAVTDGTLSLAELDESVLRILKLKIKLGLLNPDKTSLDEKINQAEKVISDDTQHKLEASLADDAITLVKNDNHLIPVIVTASTRIHILTPWLEQGAGIAKEMNALNSSGHELNITYAKMADSTFDAEKLAIDNADIIIVGNVATKSSLVAGITKLSATNFLNLNSRAASSVLSQNHNSLVFPDMLAGDSETLIHNDNNLPFFSLASISGLSDDQFALKALQYAKDKNKKTIFISLLAPYDLPNYANYADAMLVGYNYYGYTTFFRGPSMQALARIIFGVSHAKGKLPVNVPDPSDHTKIIYPRGYGLIN